MLRCSALFTGKNLTSNRCSSTAAWRRGATKALRERAARRSCTKEPVPLSVGYAEQSHECRYVYVAAVGERQPAELLDHAGFGRLRSARRAHHFASLRRQSACRLGSSGAVAAPVFAGDGRG